MSRRRVGLQGFVSCCQLQIKKNTLNGRADATAPAFFFGVSKYFTVQQEGGVLG